MAAVDATCCRIMAIDPLRIPYLSLAATGASLREDSIRQIGASLAETRTPFHLLPELKSIRLSNSTTQPWS